LSDSALGRDRRAEKLPCENSAAGSELDPSALLGRRQQSQTLRWIDRRTLFRARNDTLARLLADPTGEERSRWVAAMLTAGSDPELTIDCAQIAIFSFLVVGDPGDGDLSQFCVVPALSAANNPPTAFMVALSDVIYPAGDINEYADKFYLPYEFYDLPIYGVPGNHDWYDGLNGFMFHFCGAEPLPYVAHRASSEGASARLARRLWRRASRLDRQRMVMLRRSRAPWRPGSDKPFGRQPGPYFAIDTKSVRLIFIDTGMRGDLDREQGEWLIRQSFDDERTPKPKVLLTGKPLFVDGAASEDGRIEPIVWPDNTNPPIAGVAEYPAHAGITFCSVAEIVNHPAANYVATIGGDVHNYQRYEVTIDGRTIQHFVSGGGGAYLSAIHRFTDEVPKELPQSRGSLVAAYPGPAASVEFYSRAIVRNAPALSLYALVFFFLGAISGLPLILAAVVGGDSSLAIQLTLLVTLGTSALALAVFAARTYWIRRLWEPDALRGRLAREAIVASIASGALAVCVAATWGAHWTGEKTILAVVSCLALVMIVFLSWDQWHDRFRGDQGTPGGNRSLWRRFSFWLFALALVPPALLGAIGAWLASGGHSIGIWCIVGALVLTPFSILAVFPERKSQILPGLGGIAAAGMFLLLILLEWRWAGALVGLVGGVVWTALSVLSWKLPKTSADLTEPDRLRAAGKARRAGIVIGISGFVVAIAAGLVVGLWLRTSDTATALTVGSLSLLVIASAGPLLYLLRIGLMRPSWSGVDLALLNEEAAREWYEAGKPNVSPSERIFSLARELPNKPMRGPISDFFSEFFDSDQPPLYKSFLRVDVDPTCVQITAFEVAGQGQPPGVVRDRIRIRTGVASR